MRPLGSEVQGWDIQPDIGHDSEKFSVEGERKVKELKQRGVRVSCSKFLEILYLLQTLTGLLL